MFLNIHTITNAKPNTDEWITCVRKNADMLNWNIISSIKYLNYNFIREFSGVPGVNWILISKTQKLSEVFIAEYSHKVNWTWISINQELSENFINTFENKVDWNWIVKCQNLSEQFIRETNNKRELCWKSISCNQKLTENFIEEFIEKINWDSISKTQKLSETFILKYKEFINFELLAINGQKPKYISYKLLEIAKPYLNESYIYLFMIRKIQRFLMPILYRPGGNLFNKTADNFYDNKDLL